jgi:hypothetical protein
MCRGQLSTFLTKITASPGDIVSNFLESGPRTLDAPEIAGLHRHLHSAAFFMQCGQEAGIL